MDIARSLDDNVQFMKERLGEDVSFDVLVRRLTVGGKDAALFFFDGLVKTRASTDVIRALQRAGREDVVPNTIEKMLRRVIPYMEVSVVENLDEFTDQILAGTMGLFIDGQTSAIIMDLREYPVRSVEEPDLERVTRGSREGLVETLVFNTALIRRRVRDPNLRFELLNVGRRTKTDVAIAYIDGVVDPALVQRVKKKIEHIGADALPLGATSLQDYITDYPLLPIPTIRFTERPDVAAAHLFEGHVIIIVDTTPMALILPSTLWHFTQHAEEFFQNPVVGTYFRFVRFVGMAIALWLTPLWLALYLQKSTLPEWLQFIGPTDQDYTIGVAFQFFILEIGSSLIRLALIHTPTALATSLGIVGAILLGEFAVDVGLFIPETILYTSVVLIGYFAVPSAEIGLTIRLGRLILLALAAYFKLWGVLAGTVAFVFILACMHSEGVPYLWPLIPFDGTALSSFLFRYPVPIMRKRNPRRIYDKGN